MITNHFKLDREITDMERASISHHVEDLEGKINQLLVPLSTTQMITNHFKLNREITDMEWASISRHIKDLQDKINQVLEPLSTTHMITKHFKLNRENTDMERASSSHPVEDVEVKINLLLEALSATQLITENYKVDLENYKVDLEDRLKKLTEDRMKSSEVDIGRYRPLIRAIQENDVKAQKAFLDQNPDAMKSEIDEFGSTVFHLIVDQQNFNSETVKHLKELVLEVLLDSPAKLEILDVNGMTALNVAASAGNTKAVKVFVEMYSRLLSEAEEGLDLLPVHHAAKWGRKEAVRYLLSVTNWTEEFALDSGALLLRMLIESNLLGMALELLKHYPDLSDRKKNDRWDKIVQMLSEKYLAYESGIRLGFWKSIIYHCIPLKDDQDHVAWPPNRNSSTNCSEEVPTHPQRASTIGIPVKDDQDGDLEMQNPKSSTIDALMKKLYPSLLWNALIHFTDALMKKLYPSLLWNALIHLVPKCIKDIHDQKLMHRQTVEIVGLMISEGDWTYKEASERLKKPVLTAARLGIHEFVNEVLKAYPNSGAFYDKEGRNIFLLAVLYRKEKVFSLIHEQVVSIRDYSNYVKDKEGRNILHLAGELVPSSHVPGAALQMQREMQWFKGIKDFFQPFLQEQHNKSDKTPKEVFTEKHKKLMEDGEKWMRDTATSCSVVAALIITIVFAAAFTIPGGVNSNGIPNYLNETSFRIFAISLAIALFASTTSVQMFLGMLTSRYAEEDFLEALPSKLIIGLITLFMSSLSMMVAFGAAFCIAISHPWKWVIILICLLGCLPVTLFAWMQFPLLAEICHKTHFWPRLFKKKPTSSKRYCVLDAGCFVVGLLLVFYCFFGLL